MAANTKTWAAYKVTKEAADVGKFRTPSLRDVIACTTLDAQWPF